MKKNIMVTDHQIEVPPGQNLVSKTDLKGRITYANDAFVSISGYSESELIGKPHNIVRHPDVPLAVFESLWDHVKQGHPWKGTIKNRAKNGDFYWVNAVVVPIRKEDQIIGYMSVRSRASEDDIANATRLFNTYKNDENAFKLPNLRNYLTIRAGYVAGSFFVAFLMLSGAILGIGGLRDSNNQLAQLQSGTLIASRDIAQVKQGVQEIRSLVLEIGPKSRGDSQLAGTIAEVRTKADEAMHRLLTNRWLENVDENSYKVMKNSYEKLMNTVVIPVEYMLEHPSQIIVQGNSVLRARAEYEAVIRAVDEMDQRQAKHAAQGIAATEESNLMRERIALFGLLVGILIVSLVGFVFQRRILTPLDQAIKSLDHIAQGDLGGKIDIYQIGETGQLLRASAVMQLQLHVIIDEIRMVARKIYDYVHGLNQSLYELNGVVEEQHDGLYRTKEMLAQVGEDSATCRARIARLGEHLETLGHVGSDTPDLAQAMMVDLVKELSVALSFQNLSATESSDRIQRVADLVVDSREGTEMAYAASQSLQKQADELLALVSYFETKVAYPVMGQDDYDFEATDDA